jgi:hypothetical protein
MIWNGRAIRSAADVIANSLIYARPFFAKATKGILRCAKNGCGGWTRTSDLEVMGLASYQLLYPASVPVVYR